MEHYLRIGHFYKHSTLVSNVIQSWDVCTITHMETEAPACCLAHGHMSAIWNQESC